MGKIMKIKEDIIKFVTSNMVYIGFGNYVLALKEVKRMDSLASIMISEVGQEIILTIPKSFYKKDTNIQINILLHELIHCREDLKNQRIEEYCKDIKDKEEEICVNDITTLTQNWENTELY
jgi:hypothetical protein